MQIRYCSSLTHMWCVLTVRILSSFLRFGDAFINVICVTCQPTFFSDHLQMTIDRDVIYMPSRLYATSCVIQYSSLTSLCHNELLKNERLGTTTQCSSKMRDSTPSGTVVGLRTLGSCDDGLKTLPLEVCSNRHFCVTRCVFFLIRFSGIRMFFSCVKPLEWLAFSAFSDSFEWKKWISLLSLTL